MELYLIFGIWLPLALPVNWVLNHPDPCTEKHWFYRLMAYALLSCLASIQIAHMLTHHYPH